MFVFLFVAATFWWGASCPPSDAPVKSFRVHSRSIWTWHHNYAITIEVLMCLSEVCWQKMYIYIYMLEIHKLEWHLSQVNARRLFLIFGTVYLCVCLDVFFLLSLSPCVCVSVCAWNGARHIGAHLYQRGGQYKSRYECLQIENQWCKHADIVVLTLES